MRAVCVKVFIGSIDNANFNGTAFFINENTLITAKHVVVNNNNEVYKVVHIKEIPGGGYVYINSIELCDRDIAILKVKRKFSIPIVLLSDTLEEKRDVNILGYFDGNAGIKTYNHFVVGYVGAEHTYELQNYISKGISGSPVFIGNDICAIAQARNKDKNLTYAIPISECCSDFIQKKLNKTDEEIDNKLDEKEVSQILDNSDFRIVLSRRYSNSKKYEEIVDKVFSNQDFNVKNLHIYEYDFNILRELSLLFDLTNESSIELRLDKKLKNSKEKHLLIIKNFEDISSDIKERFAKLLRSLIEDNENFYLIIFGGKRLAKLAYENGNTSLFSNATIIFSEDKSNLKETIQKVTGGHPKLNELCKNMKEDEDSNYYEEQLRCSATSPIIFNGYNDEDKLCRFLDRKDFGSYNIWNKDELIRDLFWENLLKEEKGRLIWRSEFIRQLGKDLKCET